MTKEFPKYIYTCQKDEMEFHLQPAANKHTEETGHRDFWFHVNGESRIK